MILNLTRQPVTPEQAAQGIVDMPPEQFALLRRLLDEGECSAVAELACNHGLGGDMGDDQHPTHALIDWVMLEDVLYELGITPIWSGK